MDRLAANPDVTLRCHLIKPPTPPHRHQRRRDHHQHAHRRHDPEPQRGRHRDQEARVQILLQNEGGYAQEGGQRRQEDRPEACLGPATIASRIGMPARCRSVMKSIITMESLTTTPLRPTKPKMEVAAISNPRIRWPSTAPTGRTGSRP